MSFVDWLLGRSDNDQHETKTEEETRTLTNYYTVTRATVTYPDGSDETIEYTDATFGDNVTKVRDHTENDYTVFRDAGWGRYSSPHLKLNIDQGKPRRFSMSNIRDIEPDWVDEMVAVAEVEAKVDYERDGPDEDWEQVNIRLKSGEDVPDVTIWHKSEWKAEQN